MVAELLDGMIRDALARGKGMFLSSGPAAQRPVLILLDRNIDLAVALGHTSTYQALVDDLVGLRTRRVTIPAFAPDGRKLPKSHVYDLDPATDSFWHDHAGSPFPEAIEANEVQIKEISAKEEAVRRASTTTDADAEAELAEAALMGTKSLAEAVDSLPALLKQKAVLEMHTNVLQAVMNVIKQRQVPFFFEAEVALNKEAVTKLLSDPRTGSFTDKVRLACVYVLKSPSGVDDFEDIAGALRTGAGEATDTPTSGDGTESEPTVAPVPPAEVAAGLKVLEYAKTHRNFARMTMDPSATGAGAPSRAAGGGAGSKWLASVVGHTSSLISKAAQSVKTLVSGEESLPVTRIVQAVCEPKAHPEVDTYVTLDPKVGSSRGVGSGSGAGAGGASGAAAAGSSYAVVFIIGGGSYHEYQNVQDWCKKQTTETTVLYGATEVLPPEAFLEQVGRC